MAVTHMNVGGISVTANTTTPCRVEVAETQGWHIAVPFAGELSFEAGRQRADLKAGASALLLPNIERATDRGESSLVVASFQPAELQRRIDVMSAGEHPSVPLDARMQTLGFDHRPGLFRAFTHICNLLDDCEGDTELAGQLGIEDLMYRWMATVLMESRAERGPEPSRNAVDHVCDLIVSMTESRPLSLTEMEAASGLSARALQYGFQARFGCSPMQWQQRERMIKAHQRLIALPAGQTITDLAHAMGFSSSSAFTALYKQHFGETPSQTARRLGRESPAVF